MARYRRRFDIIADIMRVAGKGASQTRIMYFANLSYLLLKKYLGETLRMGFLRFADDEYEVTEKGQAFLERYAEFSSKFSRVERDVETMKFEKEMLEKMCSPMRKNSRTRKTGNSKRRRIAAMS